MPIDPPHGNSIADAVANGETLHKPGSDPAAVTDVRHASPSVDDLVAPSEETKASKRLGRKQRKRLNKNDPLTFIAPSHLFVTPRGETYAKILCDDHYENWPIDSRPFKRWLSHEIRKRLGIIANNQALQEIVQQFDAIAYQDGTRQEFWLRVGRLNRNLYLDLADDLWRAIEISPYGCRIVAGEALFFRRTARSQPLCEPEFDYTVNELRSFVNFESEDDFTLFVAAMVAALRDNGPYPLTFIHGEHGSGKSNLSRIFSDLVNPSSPKIQFLSRDQRDFIVAAQNSHTINVDNASYIDGSFSDLMSAISTGVGCPTRALHTNSEEFIFDGARVIVINGIPSLIERPDLMSRAIIVRLAHIPEDKRLTERELSARWKIARPRILGALCDALSSALRNLDNVRLDRPSRMADVEEWLLAAEQGLGWEPGTFSEAFQRNQKDAGDTAFEADLVAVAIKDWLDRETLTYWLGTMTGLLGALDSVISETTRQLRNWPKTSQGLGNAIARSMPLLRRRGIIVEKQHSGERKVIITRAESSLA